MDFYIEPDFAGSIQDGSAAHPWTGLDPYPNHPAWTAINNALATSDVTVYFSARNAGSDTNQISYEGVNLARTNTSGNRLIVDGMSKCNTNDTSPAWADYSGSSKTEIRYGYAIASFMPGTGSQSCRH